MSEVKKFKSFYNKNEIQTMNIIFGKNAENNWFSRDELSFANGIDLLNADLEKVRNDWNSNFLD